MLDTDPGAVLVLASNTNAEKPALPPPNRSKALVRYRRTRGQYSADFELILDSPFLSQSQCWSFSFLAWLMIIIFLLKNQVQLSKLSEQVPKQTACKNYFCFQGSRVLVLVAYTLNVKWSK